MKSLLRASTALIAVASLAANAMAAGGDFDGNYDAHAPWKDGFSAYDDGLDLNAKIELLRQRIKYVFVIFHENESFDHYFGTFPGADGLFSAPRGAAPANETAGFAQRYLDTALNPATISPFLMPQAVVDNNGKVTPIYPADLISVDHSHQGMANSMNVDPATGVSANDRYAMDQEGLTTNANGDIVTKTGVAPTSVTLAQKQKAEADVSHIDCDTIPFMWNWAKNFVLFDNFRQTIVGPSTPNAIAVIAGQSGQTQWALHPEQGAAVTYANASFPNPLGAGFSSKLSTTNSNAFVPVIADPGPFPGSNLDANTVKPPYNFDENPANPALNLTFASQPLSFMGHNIQSIIASDPNPMADLRDVQEDILKVAKFDRPVNWGWYQQGFNGADAADPYEPPGSPGSLATSPVTPPSPAANPALYSGYILHHNGPQYFGYLADNPAVLNANLHGAKDFFDAVENQKLPADGGVFYLRGGYNNNDGMVPLDPSPQIKDAFLGNDDHPAYSDQQISEAFAARAINDIAASPYWRNSAIIITYDETDGFYDHVSPHIRNTAADGSALAAGPRIPALVISPWAASGKISHRYSEHGSIIKFINELKGLAPLATLPDERKGFAAGVTNLGQYEMGPSDDPSNEVGDLTEAFDYARLAAVKPLIPRSDAIFSAAQLKALPHLAGTSSPNGYTNGACKAIGVLPTDFASWDDYDNGKPIDPYPADVNPRPTQSPGTPTAGNWTP